VTYTHQDEPVAYTISGGSWLFRRFDTDDDETPFRFSFLRWVKCGVRDDFAAIEIVDPWTNYRDELVRHAFFAARHEGVDLRALEAVNIPAHVHLLTTSPELIDAAEIDPNLFQRAAWMTVEPSDWRDTHLSPIEGMKSKGPVVYQRRPSPGR
jgi:hypothetical protein